MRSNCYVDILTNTSEDMQMGFIIFMVINILEYTTVDRFCGLDMCTTVNLAMTNTYLTFRH